MGQTHRIGGCCGRSGPEMRRPVADPAAVASMAWRQAAHRDAGCPGQATVRLWRAHGPPMHASAWPACLRRAVRGCLAVPGIPDRIRPCRLRRRGGPAFPGSLPAYRSPPYRPRSPARARRRTARTGPDRPPRADPEPPVAATGSRCRRPTTRDGLSDCITSRVKPSAVLHSCSEPDRPLSVRFGHPRMRSAALRRIRSRRSRAHHLWLARF